MSFRCTIEGCGGELLPYAFPTPHFKCQKCESIFKLVLVEQRGTTTTTTVNTQ